MQFQAYIPFRIANVLIADEISVDAFIDTDCNGDPFLKEIWIENLEGKPPLKLSRKDNDPAKAALWADLSAPAWEAVKGDVSDAMLEAA